LTFNVKQHTAIKGWINEAASLKGLFFRSVEYRYYGSDRRPERRRNVGTRRVICACRYEASFGSYDVDEATHTLTHHVQGSNTLDRLVGKDLPRVYKLTDDGHLINSFSQPR
jgi:hypothetical protein